MFFKPDWLETKQRLIDFWNGKYIGRPAIAIHAPDPKQDINLPPVPEKDEDRYLNIDWYLKNLEYRFLTTAYLGEALPSDPVLAGYTISYGAKVKFSPQTIWIEPVENLDIEDEKIFELDWNSPEMQRFLDFYTKFVQAGSKKFLIGQPAILPGNDFLSMIMGSEKFLMALIDKPDVMEKAVLKLAKNWVSIHRKLNEICTKYQDGYGICWLGLWCPYPFIAAQSDISCMLSKEMFERFIIPEIELAGREFGAVVYHLDGPGALHHVDSLCKIPEIKMIQWVPGAGSTYSVEKWLWLYKKIQDAGKMVMAYVLPEEVEFFIKNLDAKLSYLCTSCKTKRDAADILLKVEKCSRCEI
ncbi:MAG: hypothetical protein NC913_01020 [Candidatus Omnitrophica bacterium]|nr:hypothetical protein [Candidatus Omnitrophota bacterium]